MGRNLSTLYISQSYQFLTQLSGSELQTGLGSTITGSLLITSSRADTATTASYVLNAVSASYAINATSASYTPNAVTTASVSSNTITFTKGDGTTFPVTIATGSAVTVSTGSLMVTGSVSSNTLTFTKGDGSTFSLLVATGSAVTVNTGSLLVTSSVSNATITFTKGDGTTYTNVVNNVTNATSASYVLNAVSASFASTASYVVTAQTASYVLNAVSSSFASTASFVKTAQTASNTPNAVTTASISSATITFTKGNATTFPLTVNNVANATSASYAVTSSFASTAATATSASFATTASYAVNATTAATASFIPSNVNLNVASISASTAVFQSASIGFLTTITGSVVNIGNAFVLLNTSAATRYAGIKVEDSGSNTPTNYTGSFIFDSQTNDWFYEYSGSDATNFGVAMFGPEYGTIGSPSYLTNNKLAKGNGGHHLNDSTITDNGTNVVFTTPISGTQISASVGFSGNLIGNVTGTATTASFVLNAVSSSFATTASYALTATSASYAVSASQAQNAVTASFALNVTPLNTGSFLVTASVSNATITYTKGDGTTFTNIVNNVVNATSASIAVSASFASTASFVNTLNQPVIITGSLDVSGSINQLRVSGPQSVIIGNAHGGNGISQALTAGSVLIGIDVGSTNSSWSSTTDNIFIGKSIASGLLADPGNRNILIGLEAGNLFGDISVNSSDDCIGIGRKALNGCTKDNVLAIGNYAGLNANVTNEFYLDNLDRTSNALAISNGLMYGKFNASPALQTLRINAGLTVSGSLAVSGSVGITGATTIAGATTISGLVTINNSASADYWLLDTKPFAKLSTNTIILGRVDGADEDFIIAGRAFNGTSPAITMTDNLFVYNEIAHEFTGSVGFYGAVQGNVSALTITSNTASLDCDTANFFTLTLVSGSNTLINPSNINSGQTLNLRITQASPGNGTVSFPSSVKQVSGSAYVPTAGTAPVDIVTFIAFDTASLFLSNVKNLV